MSDQEPLTFRLADTEEGTSVLAGIVLLVVELINGHGRGCPCAVCAQLSMALLTAIHNGHAAMKAQ